MRASFVVAAGAAATVAVAVPALATTVGVDGGTWTYDADWSNRVNYSYYQHPSQKHGSSVSNVKYGLVRSLCENPNVQAQAAEELDTNGGNKAYYRFC
jgi:lactococcin 972 family bacteriocin